VILRSNPQYKQTNTVHMNPQCLGDKNCTATDKQAGQQRDCGQRTTRPKPRNRDKNCTPPLRTPTTPTTTYILHNTNKNIFSILIERSTHKRSYHGLSQRTSAVALLYFHVCCIFTHGIEDLWGRGCLWRPALPCFGAGPVIGTISPSVCVLFLSPPCLCRSLSSLSFPPTCVNSPVPVHLR
jgi:hypothetical protein